MSKEVLVIVLGMVTAVSPFLGLPGDWRTILTVILGLGLSMVGFFLRSETLERGGVERSSFFVDNRHSNDTALEKSSSSNPPIRVQ
jgi:hypothetical protein